MPWRTRPTWRSSGSRSGGVCVCTNRRRYSCSSRSGCSSNRQTRLSDRLIHQIGAQLLVPAQAYAPKAVGISADAAVISIRACMRLAGAGTAGFAVISLPAPATPKPPLQQIARSASARPRVPLILLQLLGHRLKERGLHQGRDGNVEPLLYGFVPHRVGFLRL